MGLMLIIIGVLLLGDAGYQSDGGIAFLGVLFVVSGTIIRLYLSREHELMGWWTSVYEDLMRIE